MKTDSYVSYEKIQLYLTDFRIVSFAILYTFNCFFK